MQPDNIRVYRLLQSCTNPSASGSANIKAVKILLELYIHTAHPCAPLIETRKKYILSSYSKKYVFLTMSEHLGIIFVQVFTELISGIFYLCNFITVHCKCTYTY